MKIAYVAAGAAGMYCGSCIHDNTLAAALQRLGHEVALLPTYTPLRTDEEDVSTGRMFYGAVNVYLQLKAPLFRRTPAFLDRLLDRPALLRRVSRLAGSTDARELGELALAVLQGEAGPQRKELGRLVAWLRDDYRPDLVHLTNSMFLGLARRLREELGVPVVVGLQGEDLFLDQLVEPYHGRVIEEMARRAADADRFIAPSRYYAGAMAALLGLDEERIAVVPLGIRLAGHGEGAGAGAAPERPLDGPVLGFLARVCPEKGLHLLAEAFARLAAEPGGEGLRLRAAGYLGARDRRYLEQIAGGLAGRGLGERFEYLGEVDREGKLAFLRSVDLFALPTVYRESKGMPALEAMASGVPVVLPAHGAFPEMVAATGGGVLFAPESVPELAGAIRELLADAPRRRRLGEAGRRSVHERFGARAMAEATAEVYRSLLAGAEGAQAASAAGGRG